MKPRISHALMAAVACVSLLAGGNAMAQKKIRAKFACTLQEDSHQGQGVARFVELVEKKSDGRIQIRPFYNASLGNDVQVTSALQGGTIEFVVPQTTTLTGMISEYEILDFPFLFDTEQEAHKVLDGPVGQKLLEKLPEKGLIGLGYWENGFFHFTNSKHPIGKLEDFQGLKLRSVQAKISQETIAALGANPVTLAVPEIYSALETRTADGQGTAAAVTAALKLYEVQKYLSLTSHTYGAFIPLVSKRFWDKLSEEDRQILRDAALETKDYQRKVALEQNEKALKEMADEGLEINEIAPEERQRMREAVKPVWEQFKPGVGEETFQAVMSELEKVRGK